jgi:hypothetical protein
MNICKIALPRGPFLKVVSNAVLIAAALVVTAAIPDGKGPVAVFAAPWSASPAEIVAQAGGQLVAAGRSSWIIMAVSADENFVGRLYRAGAVLVTDQRYAIGCHTPLLPGADQ